MNKIIIGLVLLLASSVVSARSVEMVLMSTDYKTTLDSASIEFGVTEIEPRSCSVIADGISKQVLADIGKKLGVNVVILDVKTKTKGLEYVKVVKLKLGQYGLARLGIVCQNYTMVKG